MLTSGLVLAQPSPPPTPKPTPIVPLIQGQRRLGGPTADEVLVRALSQESEGSIRRLRGGVELETTEGLLSADEIDYDTESGLAEARGNVRYKSFKSGEELRCSRAVYNVITETGRFDDVFGTVPVQIEPRPGVLTTDNPFLFEGRWAERIRDRYILYEGLITSCKLPKPWWVIRGPRFDIIPTERAIAHKALFRLKGVPLMYAPVFYKSLEKAPRRSGFLMPNLGNSSQRGFMLGAGYYWAMARSYDLTYRAQYFSQRGFAHLADFRGKPTQRSDFDLNIYGVNDKGLTQDDGSVIKQSGASINFTGRAELPKGWSGFAQINYLSSLAFRQAFTETFNEAVSSQVNSTAYAGKHFGTYAVHAVFERSDNFQSLEEDDKVSIRKLPSVEFTGREQQLSSRIPVWLSFESSAALARRNQPLFQTRQSVERIDLAPRLMTVLRWKHVQLVPSVRLHETYWGSSFAPDGGISGKGLFRHGFETGAELILPSVARVYNARGWFGEKLKHVIEPRASFRYVTGVADFAETIRFDEIELLNNTNEIEVSITNRLYSKKNGVVREWLSWQVWQRRYFDPDFGGVVIDGRRNVIRSTAEVSPFSFLSGPRNYSPVVSALRMDPIPGVGIEWRADYDPLRSGITNSSVSANGRVGDLFLAAGHSQVKTFEYLTPPANQFRGLIGWGRENRRGWNAAFESVYDHRLGTIQFANTQVTYNTDCCGFSVQYQRFNVGTLFAGHQFRVALAIANIGSFGTLRRQERYF